LYGFELKIDCELAGCGGSNPSLGAFEKDNLKSVIHKGCMADIQIVKAPFDNGIRMLYQFIEKGRPGAAEGPGMIMSYLRRYVKNGYPILDLSDLKGTNTGNLDDLDAGHRLIGGEMTELYGEGKLPIVLGGDHSITYPCCLAFCRKFNKRVGLIYIDAHLDMRYIHEKGGWLVVTSGNAIREILDFQLSDHSHAVYGENVVAIGIHSSWEKAYKYQESYAKEEKVKIIYDNDEQFEQFDYDASLPPLAQNALKRAGKGVDNIYLSIDMDSINMDFAPGVSAPAKEGLSPEVVVGLAGLFGKDKRVFAMDIVETSPPHDDGDRTSELAARIVGSFIGGVGER